MGRLNSWVVSHSALIIGTLRHALGREFDKLFFGPKHNIYALFMILFGLFVWYYYLSVKFVMWIVKQKIENKIKLFLKNIKLFILSYLSTNIHLLVLFYCES